MKKLALSLLIPFTIFAQDARVNGNSGSTDVFKASNTNDEKFALGINLKRAFGCPSQWVSYN